MALYNDLGGFAAVSRIVMNFYDRVLDSDTVGPYFDDVDMPALIDHQTKFMTTVLGGPVSYTDVQLKNVHRPHNITHEHFDELITILRSTLRDHALKERDIGVVVSAFENRRAVIVAATTDASGEPA